MMNESRIVTGRQIRAARALAGLSRRELAAAAHLHVNSIAYWESSHAIPIDRIEPHACTQIRIAMLAVGIEFVGRMRPGIRLCRNANYVRLPPSRAHARHGLLPVIAGMERLGASTTLTVSEAKRPRIPCGARTRTGASCQRAALPSGRCPNHGGLSTGPRTDAGRQRIARAQRERWKRWRDQPSGST